ncbi:Retrovirus-related Pol polyprotein [Labeo rohita]|uniref:Retrovirus-related Pol polyprotein n=1 Tax=Labeo rohita TaxID=84645 RepID=A0ABQ8LB63_LABRO|nr:Retrovirus-related Pol polyprotein [Labeo rohita]
MNEVFWEFLHRFVVVYIDDILIYSWNMAEHRLQRIQQVLLKLRQHHLYLKLKKAMVREIQISLDPSGVEERRGRRLRRRHYGVPGPTYLWHMDSYDKLKPYGIAINVCIDGFSRHIIWMQAHFTSNNPRVIAGYYFHAFAERRGCPQIIWSDFGTENVHINRLQEFLCEDSTGTVHGPCVFQGTSQANQRIESWWAIYRRQNADYWMDMFKGVIGC